MVSQPLLYKQVDKPQLVPGFIVSVSNRND